MNDAMRVLGDIVFVRDQYDRVALIVQAIEQRHDFDTGLRIKITGRLVGQDDGRIVHQRAGDGNALTLTA